MYSLVCVENAWSLAHGNSPMQTKIILKISVRFQIDFDELDKLLEYRIQLNGSQIPSEGKCT